MKIALQAEIIFSQNYVFFFPDSAGTMGQVRVYVCVSLCVYVRMCLLP